MDSSQASFFVHKQPVRFQDRLKSTKQSVRINYKVQISFAHNSCPKYFCVVNILREAKFIIGQKKGNLCKSSSVCLKTQQNFTGVKVCILLSIVTSVTIIIITITVTLDIVFISSLLSKRFKFVGFKFIDCQCYRRNFI